MSILIIDDSAEQRDLLATILRTAGYGPIRQAGSAKLLTRQLGMDGAGQPQLAVDVVLMDVMMPEVDGLRACREIRAQTRFQDLPIIVITAKTEPADLKAAYTAGASDFIRKPVVPEELIARVSTALSLRQEMEARRLREQELLQRTVELERSLKENKMLKGLLKICSKCKRIRTDSGYWARLEDYLRQHSDVTLEEGICQVCVGTAHPDHF